jgi:hypothetical protein
MPFWSQTAATPSLWQMSGLATLSPQYLRIAEPQEIPNPMLETQIIRLRPEHQTLFSSFLESHYGGGDWALRSKDWISRYVEDPRVIILCLVREYDAETGGKILASIMSVPFTDGLTAMSHGAQIRNVRVIEGLCVHPEIRGSGIAGIMINRMDIVTHRMFGPTAHLWAREEAYSPSALLLTSAINSHQYGYMRCQDANARLTCTKMDWSTFSTYWASNCFSWLRDGPAIVAEIPSNRRGDITVWLGYPYSSGQDVVVVVNTQRYSDDGAIYEVLWCGSIKEGKLYPVSKWTDYGTLIESIASKHKGIFFATDEYVHIWTGPWIFGKSGYHSWYLYNYLPPAFGNCKLHAIREEI